MQATEERSYVPAEGSPARAAWEQLTGEERDLCDRCVEQTLVEHRALEAVSVLPRTSQRYLSRRRLLMRAMGC